MVSYLPEGGLEKSGGNKFRLIVKINYTRQTIFIRHVLTHAEYDRERWKDVC
jgi:mRNA-degrading endonuclease HigB of HigAB toxin-antitoxin module